MISIGIIIPDRGDRPQFMENCLRMIKNQTVLTELKGFTVVVEDISYPPKSDKCDITERYKFGYNLFSPEREFDLIAFMENDDWYAPDYLHYMYKKWELFGRPDLIGTNYTIYYHLKLKKYFTFRHLQRSSAMSTLIRPGLEFTWPADHDPYTDQWLWMRSGIVNKVSFEPEHIVCVGMKHGKGMAGGEFHSSGLHRYINEDEGFLKNNLDPESYKFYSTIDFSK